MIFSGWYLSLVWTISLSLQSAFVLPLLTAGHVASASRNWGKWNCSVKTSVNLARTWGAFSVCSSCGYQSFRSLQWPFPSQLWRVFVIYNLGTACGYQCHGWHWSHLAVMTRSKGHAVVQCHIIFRMNLNAFPFQSFGAVVFTRVYGLFWRFPTPSTPLAFQIHVLKSLSSVYYWVPPPPVRQEGYWIQH